MSFFHIIVKFYIDIDEYISLPSTYRIGYAPVDLVFVETGIDYRECVRRLDIEVLPRIEWLFEQMTSDQFRSLYDNNQHCEWLENKEVCMKISKEKSID